MDKDKLTIKFDYERRFNKLFFSKDFKQKMVETCHYCPQGLTIDVDFDEKGEIEFYACCKKYNYDFSDDIVDGDCILHKTPIKEEWVDLMMEYLKNDEWLYQRVNTVYYSTFSS